VINEWGGSLHGTITPLRMTLLGLWLLLLRILRIIIVLSDTGRIRIRIITSTRTSSISGRIIIPILIIITARGLLIGSLGVLVFIPAGIAVRFLIVTRRMSSILTSVIEITRWFLTKDIFRTFMQLWCAHGRGTVRGSEKLGRRDSGSRIGGVRIWGWA